MVVRTRLNDNTFVQPKDGPHMWLELGDLFLARSKAQAALLAAAVIEFDHTKIGTSLGFPPTAVAAFATGDVIPVDEIPKSTQKVNKDSMKFLGHMVSRQNWQDEISYLPNFARRIKEISPSIYHACVK